ncbi:hypothetical protein AURDEDRAFT_184048 [Auricularia subglabra TFB-10046 SS5]|nr:hypothetical protein AURDEDRAFT_184048 [Auricularia subglabra TFB-10046 SS5]
MRPSLFVLAAVAGLAVAQNSTTGPDKDAYFECLTACGKKAAAEHSGAAQKVQKCLEAKRDSDDPVACLCPEDELVSALKSCLSSTCPAIVGELTLDKQCKQLLNGAPSKNGVGMLPVLAVTSALISGAWLL